VRGAWVDPRTKRLARLLGERGQATVEFALILPALLLLILGMLDFGKAFNYWIDETHLANAAARWAVVNQLPDGSLGGTCNTQASAISCQMNEEADTNDLKNGGGSVSSPGVQISFCLPNGTGRVGDPIQATAQATYNWFGFLTGPFGVPGLTAKVITAKATMRLEQPYNAATSNYTPVAC
jgi:TadE-like protein